MNFIRKLFGDPQKKYKSDKKEEESLIQYSDRSDHLSELRLTIPKPATGLDTGSTYHLSAKLRFSYKNQEWVWDYTDYRKEKKKILEFDLF